MSKNVSEHGDKVDASIKEEVEKALADARGIASDASLETIKEKSSALSSASMKIGQAIYSKSNAAGAQSTESTTTDDAKEAEFNEKEKSDKK